LHQQQEDCLIKESKYYAHEEEQRDPCSGAPSSLPHILLVPHFTFIDTMRVIINDSSNTLILPAEASKWSSAAAVSL
jgi:hypothetical protein